MVVVSEKLISKVQVIIYVLLILTVEIQEKNNVVIYEIEVEVKLVQTILVT